MRLSSETRRRQVISLTPLIDVVFLLLVFFMLASTFLEFSATSVSGATRGGEAQKLDELVLIQVRGEQTVAVNGRPVTIDELASALQEVSRNGGKRGVVRPLAGARVQDVVTVLEIARAAPLTSIVVVR
ncbi:MAG: biopolymer transporter ExbD [Rhizobiales bacterium]|nr:biopolymer transporter ExbD [Hyphomicrobiales bacterium]